MSLGTKQRKYFRRVFHKRMMGLIIVALTMFSFVPLSWAAESDLQDDIGEVLAQEGLTGAAWMLIGEWPCQLPGPSALDFIGFTKKCQRVSDSNCQLCNVSCQMVNF
jgi:hypothetical protein